MADSAGSLPVGGSSLLVLDTPLPAATERDSDRIPTMKIALIGFPLSGKTTLFEAISQGQSRDGIASVPVPDPRLDKIIEIAKPKKVTPVSLEWHDDIPDIVTDKPETVRTTLSAARQMDLLVCVLRLFDTPFAPYHTDIHPLRDLRFWLEECLLTDLQTVENRLERLKKLFQSRKESAADRAEAQILETMRAALSEGKPVRLLEIPEETLNKMRGFGLLSAKPMIAVANLSESLLGKPEADPLPALRALCEEQGIGLCTICATFERDLLALSPEEQEEYLEMAELESPQLPSLIRQVYDQCRLQVFYTIGEDTRAWLLSRGSSAVEAAGVIHSDLARGFIRTEVITFEDFEAHGGWDPAHKAGKMRLEGREYIVKDGDALHIRFKV